MNKNQGNDDKSNQSQRSDGRKDEQGPNADGNRVHQRGSSTETPHPDAKKGEKTLGDVMDETKERNKNK